MYESSTKFALYVLFPVLPFAIVTVCVTSSKSVPVQPSNTYPSLPGFINVISSVTTVYVSGFIPSIVPPAKSYSIVYFINSQFAVYVLSPVLPVAIVTCVCAVSPFAPVHPANVYPVFVGCTNVISLLSIVYSVGFVSSVPPFNSYVIVYFVNSQFAVYILFPVLPFSIITSNSGIAPFAPVQPANVYPSLLGFINVIFLLSIVYVLGFVPVPATVPSFKLYVIVYSSAAHTAYNVNSSLLLYSGLTFPSSPIVYSASVASAVVAHPLNVYPLLVGMVLLNSKSSSSIFS